MISNKQSVSTILCASIFTCSFAPYAQAMQKEIAESEKNADIVREIFIIKEITRDNRKMDLIETQEKNKKMELVKKQQKDTSLEMMKGLSNSSAFNIVTGVGSIGAAFLLEHAIRESTHTNFTQFLLQGSTHVIIYLLILVALLQIGKATSLTGIDAYSSIKKKLNETKKKSNKEIDADPVQKVDV